MRFDCVESGEVNARELVMVVNGSNCLRCVLVSWKRVEV